MMTSTPADKVKYLNETKAAIKNAIAAKGVEVAEDATFRSYADSIAAIETGKTLPEQEKTIEITENGSYEVTSDEGYVMSKVTATVGIVIPEPVIEALEIVENGTYAAPAGVDGYSPITVNVPTGGGGEVEPIVLTGDCSYACVGPMASKYIELYGNTISTSDITKASYMFNNYKNATIPFDINFKASSSPNLDYMFKDATQLTQIGDLTNCTKSTNVGYMFNNCVRLRYLPNFINCDFTYMNTYNYSSAACMFMGCNSLRSIPEDFLKQIYGKVTSAYSHHMYNAFTSCVALDELRGIMLGEATLTSNVFKDTFDNCYRLKNVIFATQEDGSPYVRNLKSQTIDLTSCTGYAASKSTMPIQYNSGITADDKVTDDATYQALKNDPDWWTDNIAYSRYNHDSAVATINSLPDTSAYLAANGGTNTIKFNGAAGELTDGGAINTLTEEEIAVAASRGWTVTLV